MAFFAKGLVVGACCCALVLQGCAGVDKATMGQGAGMATGAVVGGALGQHFGGRGGMIAGMIVGAAIGGMVGYEIGRSLDAQDREALNKRMALGLSQAKDNELQSWTSPKGTASSTFTVETTRKVEAKSIVMRPSNIEPTPPLEIIGEPYVVKSDTPLHSGPRANGAKIGALKKGEQLVAMGRVKGQPWMAVGRDNHVLGYVPEKVVVARSDVDAQKFERTLYASSKTPDATQVQTAAASGLAVDQVDATVPCRNVNYSIVKDGSEAEKAKVDACKTVAGHWTYQQG